MTKKIPLTQDQEAIVDDHWFVYLMQWNWWAQWQPTTQSYTAVRWERRGDKRIKIYMHRVVAQTPDNMQCDHIHHNTLDNRESELRNVTPSQNAMNRKIRTGSNSGVTGVSKRKNGSFLAHLRFEGNMVLQKTFKTIEKAIQTRREAEKKYFGEYLIGEQNGKN